MICLQENVCFLHNIQLQGLCVSPPVNIRVCEKDGVCAWLCVLKSHKPLSIMQSLSTSFLAVRLSPQSNPHTPSLLFFFWEVVQSKSKLVLSTVYWSCDTAQINTLVLFTKQTYSYTTLPPNQIPSKSQDWVVEGGGLW